jgi:hypothetical protein
MVLEHQGQVFFTVGIHWYRCHMIYMPVKVTYQRRNMNDISLCNLFLVILVSPLRQVICMMSNAS